MAGKAHLGKVEENSSVGKQFLKCTMCPVIVGGNVTALYPQHEVKTGQQQQKIISHLPGLPVSFLGNCMNFSHCAVLWVSLQEQGLVLVPQQRDSIEEGFASHLALFN